MNEERQHGKREKMEQITDRAGDVKVGEDLIRRYTLFRVTH
jgi:hypothetical protein